MTAGNNAQVHGSASARVSTEAKFREHASRQRFVRVAICVLMSCLAATASSQPTASQPTASGSAAAVADPDAGVGDGSFSAAGKASIAARVRDARAAFVAEYPGGAERERAAQALAGVLFEKDVYFLVGYLLQGTDSDAAEVFDRVEGFTGGALDGGICTEAMAPFGRWVDAVRAELGARQRGDVVDPAVVVGGELARAIAGTMTVYREYEARRNQFELARVAARQQFEAAR